MATPNAGAGNGAGASSGASSDGLPLQDSSLPDSAAGQAAAQHVSDGPSFSATRPPYMPQFTAATEMILKRMRGEAGSLSSALSASLSTLSTARPTVPAPTYEDVKRRLVMGMNTSTALTMQMPAPVPPPTLPAPVHGETGSLGSPLNRRLFSGSSASGSKTSLGRRVGIKASGAARKPAFSKSAAKAGTKRKRGRAQDDETSSLSSLDSGSELEVSTPKAGSNGVSAQQSSAPPPPPTTTKSGRQVQKPVTYNPAEMEAQTKRRVHYGKRTAEQALCRRCARMHSPASNQMVFCDGCNEGWHQMCHEPWIDDDVVRDAGRPWFCNACQVKRERHFAGKKKGQGSGDGAAKSNWAGRTVAQKRAYLSALPVSELVNLLMQSIELHPELSIFPAVDPSPNGTPRSLFASSTTDGLFTRAETTPNGPINFVRKTSATKAAKGSPSGGGTAAAGARTSSSGGGTTHRIGGSGGGDEGGGPNSRENSPLREAWPRPGMGLYSRLPPEEQDAKRLLDDNDYEAFSVMVYDERGRKVSENGTRV